MYVSRQTDARISNNNDRSNASKNRQGVSLLQRVKPCVVVDGLNETRDQWAQKYKAALEEGGSMRRLSHPVGGWRICGCMGYWG